MPTTLTQGQQSQTPGGGIINFNPNTGQQLMPGQTVQFNPVFSGGINTDLLGQNGTQPQLPVPQPTQTPQQFVQGTANFPIAPVLPAVNAASGSAGSTLRGQENQLKGYESALTKRLRQAQEQLLGRGARTLALEEEGGLTGKQQEIAALNESITAKKAAFDQYGVDQLGRPVGVERQRGLISRNQMRSAVEIGGLSAMLEAKQGNLDAARDQIDRTVALEFDPITQEIDNTKLFLDMNYGNMDRLQKRQAEALNVQMDREKRAADEFRDYKKMILDNALTNNPNSIGNIMNAKSFNDLALANQTTIDSGTPSEKVEAISSTLDLINTISNAKGLNTRVGPTSLARRFLGIGDAFGAGEAFAGSVHQLTSQQTLQTLIDLKAQGGTLGALSDQERIMLQNAASKISAWERKDKSGVGRGTWDISEKEFKKELARVQVLTQTALQRAGGIPSPLTTDDMSEINSMLQVPGTFNAANYY